MSRGDHKVSKITSEAIFAVRPISATSFILSFIICLSLLLVDIKYKASDEVRGYAHDLLLPLYKTVEVPGKFLKKVLNIWQTNQELRKKMLSIEEDNEKLQLINSQLKDLTTKNQELNLVW